MIDCVGSRGSARVEDNRSSRHPRESFKINNNEDARIAPPPTGVLLAPSLRSLGDRSVAALCGRRRPLDGCSVFGLASTAI